ncbi:copper resistance CopC/CopD family protein [Neobacillus sp. PS2-9]|uniref:copper resistance CopC/CopD family protein n=1 Tax=Neobacillus sp. PS2-9 TaxID=3070676 RepID=UPI0027DFBBFD|nr:copper resistance CopC/CopD family protein [Neobacillus sp. PS2-9]WML56146.1 copper resistance CopC/CopD family protein [Neobacillus sp. PS2-9]
MSFKKSGIVFALIFYLFLFLYPSFPSAHAYIKKSTPSENETLSKLPENVTIEFDEPIQPSFHSIEVFDSKGNRVDQKNGHIDTKNSSVIECDLNDHLPNGTYRIQWRVVSSDGHPVQGVIPFQIGGLESNPKSSNNNQESKGYTPEWDLLSIRWLQYVSNACLVGALFFYLFVLHKDLVTNLWVMDAVKKIVTFSFLTLSLSMLLSLPLQATIESGLPWSEVLSIRVLREMLENTLFGKTWIIQIDGLFLLCISTYLVIKKRLDKPILLWMTLILGVGLLLSKSFTSHAAASTNRFYSISLDFLHLLSASIWIGSLLSLATLIPLSKKKESKTVFIETIKRFSKWGIVLVIILAATGFMSSLSYIPNFRTLVSTDYGRVLTGKILLFLLMIIFAMANFVKGRRRRETGWRSTLWGELILGLIVLGLSVLLTNLPTAMASPGPFKETKTIQHGTRITFEATPNVIGENTFELWLKDEKGRPITNIEQITLTFTSLEMDMGKDSTILEKIKDGKYGTRGLDFNMSGQWNVQVHVLTKDLETLDTHFNVLVGSK